MKKLRDNYQIVIFTMVVNILGLMLFSFISSVEDAASVNYVDGKDKEIVVAFRQGDKQVKEYCQEKQTDLKKEVDKKVSKDEFIIIKDQIETIYEYILDTKE